MDLPRSRAGRVALGAGAISLLALGVYTALLLALGEDGIRPAFPLLMVALVSGLAASSAVVVAVFVHRDRSRATVGCLGVAGALFALLVLFIVGDIAAGAGPRYMMVQVEMPGAPLNPRVSYTRAAKGDSRITIRVTNRSDQPANFGLVQMVDEAGAGEAFAGRGGRNLPAVDGQLRAWTRPGEPTLISWSTGKPVPLPVVVEGASPPPRPAALSRAIPAGETISFTLSKNLRPRSTFFVFSDIPGELPATVNGFQTE